MQPSIDGTTFLLVIGVACLLAALITTLWAAWNWIGDTLALRRYQEHRPDWTPARYPGCLECEATEELGPRFLIRHQEYDHEAGVRPW